jgi:hypothetical protein
MKACEHKWGLISLMANYSWCQLCGAIKTENKGKDIEKVRLPKNTFSCNGCLTEDTMHWEECDQCCRNDGLIDNYREGINHDGV